MRSVRDPLVRQAIAMAVAVGAVGIAFGALASDGGLSLAKALALSALVYGGSAQLAALGVACCCRRATSRSGSRSRLCCRAAWAGAWPRRS